MRRRWSDRLAMGFFLGAVACLAGFNGLVFEKMAWGEHVLVFMGWEIWPMWWDGLTNLGDVAWFGDDAIVWAGLHVVIVLTLASPFVIRWLAVNRILWWLMCATSVLALVAVDGYLIKIEFSDIGPGYEFPEPGWWSLVACPLLHFLGLLCVRGRKAGSGAWKAPLHRLRGAGRIDRDGRGRAG